MTDTNFDREEVRRVLQILYPSGHGVIELDVLTQTGILPGHFDEREKLLDEIEKYDGRDNVVAIYTSLNKIKPEAFERPEHPLSVANKVASGRRIEAADVARVSGILFDIDPFRTNSDKKDSTTEAEHQAGVDAADFLKHRFSLMGWPEPVMGSSGNGATLRYLTNLPASGETEDLLQRMLKAANGLLPEHLLAQVEVDGAMFDRPRISKVLGTVTRKGQGTQERPHRRSRMISAPDELDPVQLDCIMKLVAAGKNTESDGGTSKKSTDPQSDHVHERSEPLSSDAAERLQELCAADQAFQSKLSRPALAGNRSNTECYLCARMWEAGFDRPEIYAIMNSSPQTKWAQRDEAYRQSTMEAGISRAEETRKELIGLTEEEIIVATAADVGALDDEEIIRSLAGIKKRTPAKYDNLIALIKKPHKNVRAATIREAVDKYIDKRMWATTGTKYSHTTSTTSPDPSGLHEIRVTNRHMQDISAESMPELIKHNSPPSIFVKGGCLVRTAEDETGIMRIELLSEKVLRSILSRCAAYLKVESNGKGGETTIPTNAPTVVVTDIMAQPDWPGIVPIVGLISSPVVRPDGSIVEQLGYDAATHLYYTGKTKMALNVPETPTQAEAKEAAAYIVKEVFGDFPFKDQASRANTIAALLTTLTLPLIGGNIPLGLFDKPQAGTGASLLTEIIAEIATGAKANMQTAPDSDDEWRKAITAVLISGPQIVVVDNVIAMLKSAKLSQMLTARTWSDRMLGLSKMLNLPQTAAWFATGNNIQLGGDIARRAYWIRLDAAIAQPWLRDGFRHPDLMKWVHEHRSELLSMLLTMVRAWIVAGKPKGTALRIGSFEDWSRTIGGILTYAGVEGFLENAAELYASADQETGQWDLFLEQWQNLHRDDKITAAMLKRELTDYQLVYRSLQNEMPEEIIIATDKTKRGAVALGQVLHRRAEQVFPSGRKIVATQDTHTKATWWSVVSTLPTQSAEVEEKPQQTACSQPAEVAEVILIPSSEKVEYECISESEDIREIKGKNVVGLRSTTATSASVAVDSETVKVATSANPDLERIRAGHAKHKEKLNRRHCAGCGRDFDHDLNTVFNGKIPVFHCSTCFMYGPPPAPTAPAKTAFQTRLGEVA